MDLTSALLDSWDRQARIVNQVAELVTDKNKSALPGPGSWPLSHHLAHIHETRVFHMVELDRQRAESLPDLAPEPWGKPTDDLSAIRAALAESAVAVREVTAAAIKAGMGECGGYENPVLFLQHLVWHEGWHVGLVFLGLRLAGDEVPEPWEEANVWAEFRTE